MTEEKMTIHKALAELKLLESRVQKEIRDTSYVTANKHSSDKVSGVSVDTYRQNVRNDYQKIVDLIKRRDAIKRAVVLSNALTKVVIGGKEYTVAEAIDMKNNSIKLKENLLFTMSRQYQDALNYVDRNSGAIIEQKAEQYILAIIQAQPKDSKMTTDNEAIKALRSTYIANNSYELVDPLNIKTKIDELTNEINSFTTEVDSALSVSNALTVIEVKY